MICVVDYGMGNLRSVSKALEALGGKVTVSSSPSVLNRADQIVLPGVGEFGHAMTALRNQQLLEPLQVSFLKKKPFLGICLGLQLLFDSSEENQGVRGLSLFPGRIRRLSVDRMKKLKVPHMGWNRVNFVRPSRLTRHIRDGSYFYFVHSYYAKPRMSELAVGMTSYGLNFPAILEQEPFFAVQFHPEKSQRAGLRILRNFIQY